MKNYRVFMTQTATEDVQSIADYITDELRAPDAAKRLVAEIREAVVHLGEMPFRQGLAGDRHIAGQGIRTMPVENYTLFYIVSEQERTVTIIRVLFNKRDWVRLLDAEFENNS